MVIYWIRQDLRINNNLALEAALKHDQVLLVYIDDIKHTEHLLGQASKVWLYCALKALNQSLNQKISFYQGDPLSILENLVDQFNITSIYWNRCYEPWQIYRDKEIKSHFLNRDVEVRSFAGYLLFEPWKLLKKDQTPFKVYSRFYKSGYDKLDQVTYPVVNISVVESKKLCFDKNSKLLDELNLLPNNAWYKPVISDWPISEKKILNQLDNFIKNDLSSYKKARDYPALDATSKLSPALHFGQISPNNIIMQLMKVPDSDGKAHFIKELFWRDFSYHVLFYYPKLPSENYSIKFNNFPWRNDTKLLKAWQKGRTGIPIVDAGMRELWQTGYMHNRIRMVCASFLTKNCLIDWRYGARWFWDCLFDADLANNSASWQWVAGSGFDAQPYFRIFNPILQAEKFDPEGEYIKQYVPELANLPRKHLAAPWLASADVLEKANITLGKDYPYPIVDLKTSREQALVYYKHL
ncbi:DNA photolyase family protein [Thiotrichales bacterium 19S11-10]|nr:DNA photolyase family protein [Thiotrichales bacterium 19S11-10]